MELVAVLHNIRSAHNVGSIFRTADGAGFQKIYLCGVTPTPLDRLGHPRPDLAKVALGAERYIAWEKKISTAATLKRLKKESFYIIALEQDERSTALDPKMIKNLDKVALVLGDEVKGLSSSILSLVHRIVEIPMRGKKESLNVSVAFGIAAYALAGNRSKV